MLYFEFPDNTNIDFMIEGYYLGWFGIGFKNSMVDTDMIICDMYGGSYICDDTFSYDYSNPPLDS